MARAAGEHDDVVARLRALGFGETEAKAYVALVRRQPATAYELAKVAALPRANVYGVVDGLVARGAIQPLGGRPARYVATPIEAFFARVAEDARRDCDALTEALAEIANPPVDDVVALLDGADRARAAIDGAIDAAAETVYVKTTDALARPHAEALRAAAARGVRVVVVGSGDGWGPLASAGGIDVVPHEGTGSSPSRPHEVLLTLVADSSSALVATLGEPARAWVATTPALVYVIQTMLLHELYLAEMLLARAGAEGDEGGPDIVELRARWRPARHGTALP